MKIMVSKKVKHLALLFICLFISGLILLNVMGYFLDLEYVSVIAAMEEINKYEVRSRLLMQAMEEVGVCTPEKAAEVWAKGLITRNAAMQYSVMSEKLKEEYEKQLEENFPNWVTGVSSPWVENYEIVKTESTDKNTYIFHLRIFTKTSTGPAGEYKAILTVEYGNGFWRITKISADKELSVYTGFDPEDR